MRRRVVITGMGALSSAGRNLEEARPNFQAGTCCLSAIKDPALAHLKARYAGLLPAGWESQLDASGLPPGLDKHVYMALAAARETLRHAGVDPKSYGPRLGLVFSTCSGPMLLIEAHYERILRGEPALTEEQLFAKSYFSGARVLAHGLGIQGLCTTAVTACTASAGAMAVAVDLIRCGMLDAALAGGADAFAGSTLAGFDGLKATSEGKCAPFSKPFGLNLGEAAAFVFLEPLEAARRRGARVISEVVGTGMSNDAYHCSAPDPGGRGLAAAMTRALADAGLRPEAITYLNAHGTGTEANDKAESRALSKVFGAHAATMPVSSTKSMVGHCLGAAGALEIIASLLCAEAEVLPRTANFTEPRDGCTLDYVPETGRKWSRPHTFLSSNLAFGGHNSSIVLSEPEATASRCAEESSYTGVYVTACGIVTGCGVGADVLREACERGGDATRHVSVPGLPPFRAGMVNEALVAQFDRRLDLRQMDRSSRWATVATRLALREARWPEQASALADLGLFLNLATGPSWAEEEFITSYLRNHRQVTQVMAFPYIVPSSVCGNVCRALRLTGHNLTLNGGPGAGLLGLGPAIASLRAGHVDALLCGAADELTNRILADQYHAGRIANPDDLLGEGAAVLLLETGRHAETRGARRIAMVRGMAFATEVKHYRSADDQSDTLMETVQEALAQAGVKPAAVGQLCLSLPASRREALVRELCPAWSERILEAWRYTGRLEAVGPLLDLALAWREPSSEPLTLAVVSSPQGINCAVLFERLNPS